MSKPLIIKPKRPSVAQKKRVPALVHALTSFEPGESITTREPRHRLDQYLESLEAEGYKFSLSPTPNGYRIHCVSTPSGAGLHLG